MANKPKTPGPAPDTTPKSESATELTDAELAQISGSASFNAAHNRLD
jgi:hypothetical protein